MDIYLKILEVINMRSFSNLWYWIALAVLWSTASHYVLGVPFDLMTRARKQGGETMVDLEDLVRINVNRLLTISEVSGLMITAGTAAALTALFITGFFYNFEFGQALFLMAFPMTLVFWMSVGTAQRIKRVDQGGDVLLKQLTRHRFRTQLIGMASIFVTGMWGMYQNLFVGPWGH
ncbi:hypothetical protein AQS8620_01566 [Aquimixticola soesokkakensis]|uniref:Component of SufBCD complex n=1 Tax=Aquimixticola soesokkakensis TaxID=1519096 RepID=A0A1Y5SM43_9RHOB|nr:component of SufBCD complex [Aquimixticola soesokkakensis]SLN40943.1 hypothetical protein AQS8620_01566 [Aquimixticola soesokkakensis]